jgi:hypothetical protein
MMNTFQFISSVGGAGAPEDNEGNKGFLKANLRFLSLLLLIVPN